MQKLSSLNIVLSIIYVLVYLKSGTLHSTAGIFMITVFNWLALRSFQLNDYRWMIWHYLIALWVVYFVGTLVYGAINILSSSIVYNFISDDTIVYLIINSVFCALLIIQLLMYAYKNYIELKLN
ncbi:MAG: hypothetical protein V4663_04665 [Bacteroidota bacterium]